MATHLCCQGIVKTEGCKGNAHSKSKVLQGESELESGHIIFLGAALPSLGREILVNINIWIK